MFSSSENRPSDAREWALSESPAYPENEIEGLLSALTGVLAARVSVSPLGRIEEVHLLADARLHPKQIVRNVESALSAGLGLSVDRRLISVAQVKTEEGEAFEAGPPAPPPPPPEETAKGRYIYVGYDARTQPDLEASCRVTIRRDRDVFSGTGTGPSTPLGRAQAASRAVFAAIATARRDNNLELEGVSTVESNGRSYVLIAATAQAGRYTRPLTGIATLHRSPEEAAILASLQATNRWAELDG
jgi:hypothetical protein